MNSLINIGFVNLILMIVDNVCSSKEPCNPYLSALDTPRSLRPFAPIVPDSSQSSVHIISGNPHLSGLIESFDCGNSMADFFTNVLTNSFGNFGMDPFSNLIVDFMPSLAMFSLSDLSVLSQFSRDNFPTLTINTLFALGWDIPPNYLLSAGYPLLPSLLLFGNFTTFKYPDYYPSIGYLLLLFSRFLTILQLLTIFLALIVRFPLLSHSSAILPLSLLLVEIFFSIISLILVRFLFFYLLAIPPMIDRLYVVLAGQA